MKIIVIALYLSALLPAAMTAIAAEGVVVIPMGSTRAQGADKQIQYNDNGNTAGADIVYDKASGRLETPGEIRTTDAAGQNRLWGAGRPGTGLIQHDTPDGYCTAPGGTKFALSIHLATWQEAAQVCPAGTWVCSINDGAKSGMSCDIISLNTHGQRDCDGTQDPYYGTKTALSGWMADTSSNFDRFGVSSWSDLNVTAFADTCIGLHTWCCWQ